MESAVSLLILLVCPLSMGLFMWLMMRSPKPGARRTKRTASPGELSSAATAVQAGIDPSSARRAVRRSRSSSAAWPTSRRDPPNGVESPT